MNLADHIVRKLHRASPSPLKAWMQRTPVFKVVESVPLIASVRVFSVPEANLPMVRKGIERLNRKLDRLNIEARPMVKEIGTETFNVETDELRPRRVVLHHIFRVFADATAKLPGGWQLLGLIDHLYDEEGKSTNLVRQYPGSKISIPAAYRTAGPTCDHCGLVRLRNETFVVADREGNIRRVGRKCLQDYLGGESAFKVLALAEGLRTIQSALEEAESEEESGGSGVHRYSITAFLGVTAMTIRTHGFMSRKEAEERYKMSTADRVLDYLEGKVRSNDRPTPEDYALAERTLEWARGIDPETTNDYLSNLRTLANVGSVRPYKDAGLAASMISAYQREAASEERKRRIAAGDLGEYVGKVGERLGGIAKGSPPPLAVRVLGIQERSSDYGLMRIIRMETPEGNRLITFFTGKFPPFVQVGASIFIEGTIKAHEIDREGGKQTVVSRAGFLETWEPPPPKVTKPRGQKAKKEDPDVELQRLRDETQTRREAFERGLDVEAKARRGREKP